MGGIPSGEGGSGPEVLKEKEAAGSKTVPGMAKVPSYRNDSDDV